MIEPKFPSNEEDRQQSVDSYEIVDTPEEAEFDEITQLAGLITDSPVSLITLIDHNRNWFKSHLGTPLREDPRSRSFCGHAINEPQSPFIIEDTTKDERFVDNPLVVGDTHIRFYAGFPIVNSEGFPLGTLCVMDVRQKKLSDEMIQIMSSLANQSLLLMEHHKKEMQLKKMSERLINTNKNLELFAQSTAHDLKSPLNSIIGLSKLLPNQREADNDKFEKTVQHIESSAQELRTMIDEILNQSGDINLLKATKKPLNISQLIEDCKNIVDPGEKHNIYHEDQEFLILSNEVALKRIFINLFTNSIEHSLKGNAQINVEYIKEGSYVHFKVRDLGVGFPEHIKDRLFDIYFNYSKTKKKNNIGMGLATVKSLIEGLGGQIEAKNHSEGGAEFSFHLPI